MSYLDEKECKVCGQFVLHTSAHSAGPGGQPMPAHVRGKRHQAALRAAEAAKSAPATRITIDRFGKDHWSTFGYIEVRCVDHGGSPNRQHMRCCSVRHPGLAHLRNVAPPTRLKDGTEQQHHDDWDCADDLEAAGLIVVGGTGMFPIFKMTEEGTRVAGLLRAHKATGGSFGTFDPGPVRASDGVYRNLDLGANGATV